MPDEPPDRVRIRRGAEGELLWCQTHDGFDDSLADPAKRVEKQIGAGHAGSLRVRGNHPGHVVPAFTGITPAVVARRRGDPSAQRFTCGAARIRLAPAALA